MGRLKVWDPVLAAFRAVEGFLTVRDEANSQSEPAAQVLIFPNGTVVPHADGSVSIREVPTGAMACRVRRTTTWSLSTTFVAATFDTEDSDTDGFWTSGSATRLTAPSAGYYIAEGYNYIVDAYMPGLYIRKNGSVVVSGTAWQEGGQGVYISTFPIWLNAGDYVELMCYSTGSTTAGGASGSPGNQTAFGIHRVGSGNVAGFAKEVLGRTTVGASFESATSRIVAKQVTVTKPGLITAIKAHVKGNGSNVGTIGVALYADNGGVPGALLHVGPVAPYSGTVDIFKSTTAAWLARPLNAWVEAGTYWIAVLLGQSAVPASMQIAYDGTGDYHQTATNSWFPDSSLSAFSAASRSYSINADIIYGGQGERGYREGTAFPTGVPSGTKFYRTDVRGGMLFRYDGTRWVSDQQFTMYLYAFAGASTDSARVYYGLPTDYDVYLVDALFMIYSSGAGAVWVANVELADYELDIVSTLATVSTSGVAATVAKRTTVAIGTAVTCSQSVNSANAQTAIAVWIDEQSGAVSLYGSIELRYRLIAT